MKFTFLILLLTSIIFSSTIKEEIKYESGISIYGKVGYVDLFYEENKEKNTYILEARTRSHGIVKYLSSNRVDLFRSEGIIKDGIYTPLKFTKESSKIDYNKTTIYKFDYINKKVLKTKKINEYKTVSKFDAETFAFIDTKELCIEDNSEEIDFAQNDYLTLYLNLKHNNLKTGSVLYVDKKDDDDLILLQHNLFEVQKNNGEDKYKISIDYDQDSIFFNQVRSIGIAFYGDAYIKKINQIKNVKK